MLNFKPIVYNQKLCWRATENSPIDLIRNCFVYIGSIWRTTPQFLAAVGKGRSSSLNNMDHYGSFRPGKNWQRDNLAQFCIVSKENVLQI